MYSDSVAEYKAIAEAFNIETDSKPDIEIARMAVKEIEKFKNDFNIPKKLSDYGVREEDLDILAVNAFEDACTSSNPREVTMTDIYSLLRKML